MNILIVGCGRVGNTLVRSLAREEHDVTVVDEDREVIRSITDSCDVMGFCGNGANGETLLAAGADKADLAIAVTRSDELNMLTCFLCKKLGAKRTVARIRGDYYFAKGFDFVKASIEADRVINPELLCAESAYNILRLPSAIKMETFAADKLEVAEFIVPDDSPAAGVTLAELKKNRGSNFLICALGRGGETIIPKGSDAPRAGDRICVVSGVSEMGKVIKTLGLVKRTMHSVTIVGASQTALYLARMLSAARVSVKIVEKDPEKAQETCAKLKGVTVVCGDGLDLEMMKEERLGETDALVTFTGRDEENILLDMYARGLGVKKVVSELSRDGLLPIAEKLGLTSVVSPQRSVADVMISYARALESDSGAAVETLYSLMDGGVEALQFAVEDGCPAAGKKLKDVDIIGGAILAGIIRGDEVLIPSGDDVIIVGDKVIVVTKVAGLGSFDEVLR